MEEKEVKTVSVKTDTDEFVLYGRPCELSAFSYIAPNRHLPKERTYFNVEKKERYSYSNFDRQFLKDFGYDQRLHRDDREHFKARGLHVNDEEKSKDVPSLPSSLYGKRLTNIYDPPGRQYVRIGYIETDFYRRNGTNLNNDGVKVLPR